MKKVFVHIPKNAGMTIRHKDSAIRDNIIIATRDNHISAEYSNAVLKTMEQYEQHHGYEHARWRDIHPDITSAHSCFAVVRNPWSRTVSRYTFALLVAKQGKMFLPQDYSFEQFIDDRHKWSNIPYFWHRAILGWYPQKDYVVDEHGILKCDILRCEHLSDDVMKYFNIEVPLDVHNISNGDRSIDSKEVIEKNDYKQFYTNTTYKIIADWYKQDIEFFGFTFESSATKNVWVS